MRALFAALLALILAVPAFAAEMAGVTVPDTATVGSQQLELNGVALRKKFFVKVYVAGLYLTAKETDAGRVLSSDSTRRGTMDFLHKVTQKQLCDGWMEGLEDNTENPSADVRNKFDMLCKMMQDVAVGDRLTFTYVPGEGTQIEIRDVDRGTIEGKPFADALFACWIGPDPDPGQDFKKALLGG